MTPNPLANLKQDIDDLFTEGKRKPLNEDNLKTFLTNIEIALRDAFDPKKDEERSDDIMRCSALGTPLRKMKMQQLHQKKGGGKKEISPRARKIFFLGHVFEEVIMLLLREAGYVITEEQKEVIIDGVKGHIDGKISKNGSVPEVMDAKSSSPYGMKKFERDGLLDEGKDAYGYVDQISAYAEHEKCERAHIIAFNKVNLDVEHVTVTSMDFINVKQRIKDQKFALEHDAIPPLCYPIEPDGKSGNKKISKMCEWCEFKDDCFKDRNGGIGLRKFEYSDGIRYLAEVSKVPKVKEVT